MLACDCGVEPNLRVATCNATLLAIQKILFFTGLSDKPIEIKEEAPAFVKRSE